MALTNTPIRRATTEKPTLAGIPVVAYLDLPSIDALFDEHAEVDVIASEPPVVRQYAWRDRQFGIVTAEVEDGEVMLGVQTKLVGTACDRGLQIGSPSRLVDELYGDAERQDDATLHVEYSEGTRLVIRLAKDGTVEEMQILSASLLGRTS